MSYLRKSDGEGGMLGYEKKGPGLDDKKNEKFQQAGHSHPSGSVPDLSLSHRKIDSDSGEVTEEEDWQNIGAGALYNRSCYPSGWVPDLPLSQHKINCDSGELTEEEDWRDIGAEALRNRSHLSRSATAGTRLGRAVIHMLLHTSRIQKLKKEKEDQQQR